MQSVGRLAGGVAHEFNNLLAGILGYAALGLREPEPSEPLREFLQYIVELSDRAANLTRQLLAFARKPALVRQPTLVLELLRNTAAMVRRLVSIEIVLDVQADPAEAPALLALADVNQLQQVLVNLALNARDALTKPAPITFRLRQAVLAGELPAFPQNVPPGDYVVLEVEDPGSGMSAAVLTQALDPFFTTKEVGQGTGLGLPVAFGIVQGHQGFLTLASEVGRGTCVGLYLPRLTSPAADERQEREAGDGLEPAPLPSRRILVVDDEEAVLDVVRRFLEIAGHQVTCAHTGSEALAWLNGDQTVDLVILDLVIPREEGLVTLQRLRQRRPELPVLLCTGLLQTEPASDLVHSRAVGLLRKPFRMNELWNAVNQALRG
jgi:two-component system cell cycle sensor histidine kinase/response regulator CckA